MPRQDKLSVEVSEDNSVNSNIDLLKFLIDITYSTNVRFAEGEIYECIISPKDNRDFVLVKHPNTEDYCKIAKNHEGRLFKFIK